MDIKLYNLKKLPLNSQDSTVEKKLISRNKNHKGELVCLSIDNQVNYIAYMDYKVGNGVRGNHYHIIKEEYLYLCTGKIKGYFKSINNDEIYEELIEEGTLIQIMPGCIHAFEAVEDGHAIEYSINTFGETCDDKYFYLIR